MFYSLRNLLGCESKEFIVVDNSNNVKFNQEKTLTLALKGEDLSKLKQKCFGFDFISIGSCFEVC